MIKLEKKTTIQKGHPFLICLIVEKLSNLLTYSDEVSVIVDMLNYERWDNQLANSEKISKSITTKL